MRRLLVTLALAGGITAVPAAPALAGPGGVLTVSNATAQPVVLGATPLKCMFTRGESGSRLDAIDGTRRAPFAGTRPGIYVEGANSGDALSEGDQRALLQGWLIGPARDGVARTRMRQAARRLAGALGSGGLCRFADSQFGVLAYTRDRFVAAVVRVSSCVLCPSTSWDVEASDADGLSLDIGRGSNPVVTIDDAGPRGD